MGAHLGLCRQNLFLQILRVKVAGQRNLLQRDQRGDLLLQLVDGKLGLLRLPGYLLRGGRSIEQVTQLGEQFLQKCLLGGKLPIGALGLCGQLLDLLVCDAGCLHRGGRRVMDSAADWTGLTFLQLLCQVGSLHRKPPLLGLPLQL